MGIALFWRLFVSENGEQNKDGNERRRAEKDGIIPEVGGGQTADCGACRKKENNERVDAAFFQLFAVFRFCATIQIERRLTHIVGAERRAERGSAAFREDVVLQCAQKGDGDVCIPIGSACGNKRERRKRNDFDSGDDQMRAVIFKKIGHDRRDEDARKVCQNGIEVVRRVGKTAFEQPQGEQNEVARLGIAEHAAV